MISVSSSQRDGVVHHVMNFLHSQVKKFCPLKERRRGRGSDDHFPRSSVLVTSSTDRLRMLTTGISSRPRDLSLSVDQRVDHDLRWLILNANFITRLFRAEKLGDRSAFSSDLQVRRLTAVGAYVKYPACLMIAV